jgi:hypothetical protein
MTWEEFEEQEVAKLKRCQRCNNRIEYIRYIAGRMNGDMTKLKNAWGEGKIKPSTYVYIANSHSTSSRTMGVYSFESSGSSTYRL